MSQSREDGSGRADGGGATYPAEEAREGGRGEPRKGDGSSWSDITVTINGEPFDGVEDVAWSETRQLGRGWPASPVSYTASGSMTIAGHHGRNLGRFVDSLSAGPNRHQRRRARALARRGT